MFVFASCSKDDPTPSTVKYVTINLQIGGDSTLSLSGGGTSFDYSNSTKEFIKPISATRAVVDGVNVPNFVPKVPKTFTAYLVANENTTTYPSGKDNAQVIASVTVHTGSNHITVPAMKYKVFVTNYSNGNEKTDNGWSNWYTYPDALAHLPAGSTTLYLYGKSDLDFTNGAVGEVRMTNPYAAICVYKNKYVTGNPSDWSGTTALRGDWYYLYKNCFWEGSEQISLGMEIPITYINSSRQTVNRSSYIYDTISANYIYQYIIDNH